MTKEKNRASGNSYWSLVKWRFKKNRLAKIGGVIVLAFYLVCVVFPEFFAPYTLDTLSERNEAKPQRIVFRNAEGGFSLLPAVYGLERKSDAVKRIRYYDDDRSKLFKLRLFARGDEYRLFGLIPGNIHLIGVDAGAGEYIHILGTDRLGRDMLSRIIYGGRLSLLLGLIGQVLTLIFGTVLGLVSGYFGGKIDMAIQRLTEFLGSFPDIPLFMALAAVIPATVSPIAVYFMLTLILVFVRWGGLCRQVRGLTLSLREREYVLASRSAGAGHRRIIFKHLLPGTFSHVIVIATLSIPGMILAETALSWLGLGLRPPLTSWGVLLQEVSSIMAIRYSPWLLATIPCVMVVILSFNMLGDGLRDALDPYGER